MMPWHYGTWAGGWNPMMLFAGLLFVIFVAGALLLFFLLLSSSGRTSTQAQAGSAHKQSPLDIAKERYARGDISREEFEQIKEDLAS